MNENEEHIKKERQQQRDKEGKGRKRQVFIKGKPSKGEKE